MNLSVVVVSAGSVVELNECLARIVSQDSCVQREVIVVDDSVHQQSGRFIRETYSDAVALFAQGSNTGAAAARNRGIRNAVHDYLLFVDSDCFLPGDFFRALRGAVPLLEDRNVAGLSFKVRGVEGIFSQGIKTDFLFRAHNLTTLDDTIQEVESVNTCCCLLKKELFRHRGFREDFHYIFEDVEFSRYARTQGYRFLYYPFCTAFHREGSFKASYARKTFFSYRNRLLTILSYEERPFFLLVKTFPYELMRTVKLFLLNPFFLARALGEVLRFSRQKGPAVWNPSAMAAVPVLTLLRQSPRRTAGMASQGFIRFRRLLGGIRRSRTSVFAFLHGHARGVRRRRMKYRRAIIFSTSAYVYGAERGLLLLVKWGLRKKLFERIYVVLPGKGPLQAILSGNAGVNVIIAPFPFILSSDRSMTLKTLFCLPFSVLYWVLYMWTHRIREVISNTSLVSVSLPLALLFPHALLVRECFPGKRWFSRYQRLLCRVSKPVLVVSSFVTKQLGFTGARLLHEPIDSSFYHFYPQEEARKKWGIPSGARVISFVGRLHPVKGCGDFLDEIEALGALAGTPGVFFLIAGDIHPPNRSMNRYKKTIMEKIRKISLRHGIAFLGYVADIGSVYAASDICVFPYRRDEFYGFSILEALFYGKKILLSRCGGGISDYLTVSPETMRFTRENLLKALSAGNKNQLSTVHFPKLSTYIRDIASALA